MVRMIDRNPQGRDTAEGIATAVIDPSGKSLKKTTEELLTELLLYQKAIVLGLTIMTDTDLLSEVRD